MSPTGNTHPLQPLPLFPANFPSSFCGPTNWKMSSRGLTPRGFPFLSPASCWGTAVRSQSYVISSSLSYFSISPGLAESSYRPSNVPGSDKHRMRRPVLEALNRARYFHSHFQNYGAAILPMSSRKTAGITRWPYGLHPQPLSWLSMPVSNI